MPSPQSEQASRPLRFVPIIIVLGGAIAGILFLGERLNYQWIQENSAALLAYRDAHFVSAALLFVGTYVVIVTFSLPGAALASVIGGYLFAIFPGVLLNMTGATIGATLVFLAARWGGGEAVSSQLNASEGTIRRIKRGLDENQWSFLFVVRLLPILPFFALNLVLAMVGVPLHRFVISTFLGIIPGALVYTSIGVGLGELLARGEAPDLGVIFEPKILLPILGLAALAMLPVVVKIIRKKKET